ncbi:hypothetical protein IAR55_004520 [Kwoniella newhampshirensis]|uniref:Uncharacterized protein n=1 Tax=Kwoniella newhampshirensis TaxID=1651941 RepID=A0AAW0YPQ6_9TREE
MTSLARPINVPTSRPSYSSSSTSFSSHGTSRSNSFGGTSPSSRTGTSPAGQHPCPHLSEFVQQIYKAWGHGHPVPTQQMEQRGRKW